jgi:hypothetical protein
MPVIIPVSLDVQTAEVLDARTAGLSTDTNSLSFKATGLLRYETNLDSWKYFNGSSFVPLSGLPTRTNIPLTSDDMTKVLMEGHLNGGVGDTGALWQQLSLNHLSDMEFISVLNMHRTSYGMIVRGNVQTEDANGVTNFTLTPTGDVVCNDLDCSHITCSDIVYDTLNTSSLKTRTKEYSFNLLYTNSWATFATISRNFNTNNWRSCMVEFCVAYSTSNGGGSGGGSYAGNFRYNFASGTRSVAVFGISTLYNNGGYVAFQFSALNTSGQAGGVQVQMRNYRGITQSVVVSMKITSLDYFDMT